MKKLLIGATVLALLTGQVAVAQPDNHRMQRNESAQRDQRHDGEGRQQRRDRERRYDRDGEQYGDQWRNGRWHDQNGRREARRHRGWSRDRGHAYHWSRGQRVGYNDWRYAQRIDYRRYNLRQPPRGYEWRGNDDRFLMVAVATGLIASVILRDGRR